MSGGAENAIASSHLHLPQGLGGACGAGGGGAGGRQHGGLPAFAALDYVDFRTFFLLPPAHLMPLGLVKSFWEMVLTRVRCQLGA